MLELFENNALDYLRERGDVPDLETARVDLLGWGVSNVVLRVFRQSEPDFIIKQSRPQLRTKAAWFSRMDRIFREIDMLRLLQPMLPAGVIPQYLFEDRENYLFAMEAFPAHHVVWKQALLDGNVDPSIAARLGTYLSTIHGQTAFREDLKDKLGDLEVFDQLRLDPFYRYLAQARPVAEAYLTELVAENLTTSLCLVLADFSPKNILIAGDRIALVDFETGHFGDPAFDLGFFLSHLLLKAVCFADRFDDYAELTRQFWLSYRAGMDPMGFEGPLGAVELLNRTWRHLAGCMWARVDGKSPVDYLTRPVDHEIVRTFSLSLFQSPPSDWNDGLARLRDLTGSPKMPK